MKRFWDGKVLLFWGLFLLCFAGNGLAKTDYQIRVGLFSLGFPQFFFVIPSDGRIEILDSKSNQTLFSGNSRVVLLKSDGEGMQVYSENSLIATTRNPIMFSSAGKPPHFLWIGSKKKLDHAYRGSIMVVPFKNRLFAVNFVGVEEYLRSVVPSEIGNKAPLPALISQAIAARTYALKNLARHAQNGFHLCDEVHCQVYSGILRESMITSQSVESTRDLVLIHDGKVANTVYHANCGGKLSSSKDVWKGKEVPYLLSHEDRIGNGGFFCAWAAGLYKGGQKKKNEGAGKVLKQIQIPAGGKSSRGAMPFGGAIVLYSINGNENYKVYSHQARGHRVGMCQDGAVGMAKSGYNAQQILTFYYPGTSLHSLDRGGVFENPVVQMTSEKVATQALEIKVQVVQGADKKNVFFEKLNATKGKKADDFRKWFWCNIPPKIHGKNEKPFHSKEKRKSEKKSDLKKKKRKKT